MKKSLIILSILFISLAFVAPIQASAATSAGVKPGNFFYFFDTAFENVGLFFTFNSEGKAKKALEYADERLAEIEAIAEEKNPDAVKAAITNYESNVALATEKSKEVKDKGQAENLLTLIEDSTSRNQEILSAVLIKVPEEAKEAIMQAIEASRKGQEEATKQISELKSEVEKLKKEVAELKSKEEGNTKTSEESNNQKSKNISTPTKSQTSPVSESTQTPKLEISAPFQTPTKVSEPQITPPANQPPSNTTNTTQPPTTQPPVTPEPSPIVSPSPAQTPTPTPTPISTPTPTPAPEPTPPPKIAVSASSDNPVGKNIIKGEKGVTVLGLNIENGGGTNVRIDNLKIRLVGTSLSNLQDLKIKIGGQLYSAVYTNGDIKTYNPGYTLNPNVPIQVLVQADVALTANDNSFHVEIIEVSGANTTSGEGAKTSDVVTGNTFTIYQPATTNTSPVISTATDISFLTNTDDVGTVIRFDAKNNPFSILKIILTFSGVDELDINNVKLLIGGNAWHKLYPTATNSATGQKVAYIEGNKIIFQNFSPHELFHVNRNEILDLVVFFEMKPTAFWKTLRVDIPNASADITAFDYETGLILPVGGSSIGNSMTITNKKYYSGY